MGSGLFCCQITMGRQIGRRFSGSWGFSGRRGGGGNGPPNFETPAGPIATPARKGRRRKFSYQSPVGQKKILVKKMGPARQGASLSKRAGRSSPAKRGVLLPVRKSASSPLKKIFSRGPQRELATDFLEGVLFRPLQNFRRGFFRKKGSNLALTALRIVKWPSWSRGAHLAAAGISSSPGNGLPGERAYGRPAK